MKQTFYENRFSYFPLLIQNGTASDGPVILEPEDPVKTDETQKNGQNQDTPGSSQIGLTIAGVGLGLLAAGFASWAGINEDEDDSGYEEEDEQPISDEAFGIIIGISSLVMIVGLIIYAFEVSNNTDKKDKTAYFDQQMQKAFAVKTFYNSNSIALAAPDVKLNLMKVKF
jgi:hypothetical protein